MMKTLRRAVYVGLALGFLVTSVPSPVSADPPQSAKRAEKRRKKGRKSAAPPSEAHAKQEKKEAPIEPKPEDKGTAKAGPSAEDQARIAAQESAQGVNSEVVKEGDGSVKVMRFTGLDIEGRLKSPQLLYFVNRMRAEFDRPKLPHRSFMPELERSTNQEPLR